jgi:hypothetical protein
LTALREIVRTCSNVHVARAALASIGGEFAARFAADASRRDMPSGVLAARMVRAFGDHAAEHERRSVDAVTRGADQPVLAGLRYILARSLGAERTAIPESVEALPAAWAICAARDAIWHD